MGSWAVLGGKPPKCTDKTNYNLYARVSEASERLKNIYSQVSKYICIHRPTINAVPFYYLWHGAIYTTVYNNKQNAFSHSKTTISFNILLVLCLRNIFSGLNLHLHIIYNYYTINAVSFYYGIWHYV